MRKRNDITKKTPLNHIENVNMEIDYEKLAEAIVKANKISNEPPKSDKDTQQLTVWKSVSLIIRNKKGTDGSMTSSIISIIISALLNFFAFILALFYIVLPFYCIAYVYQNFIWSTELILENIIEIILMIFFILFLVGLSIIFRVIAIEIAEEKDRNYIIAFSSSFISLIALFFTLITILNK